MKIARGYNGLLDAIPRFLTGHVPLSPANTNESQGRPQPGSDRCSLSHSGFSRGASSLACGAVIFALLCPILFAADVVEPVGEDQAKTTPLVSAPTPPAPPKWNPVDAFRRLLAMSPEERQNTLAGRTEKQRKYLDDRLREFERLSPVDRELRLRLLELQWYLLPLLKLQPEQRTPYMEAVPDQWQAIIKERLAAWDRLPPEQQRELLASESTLARMPALLGSPDHAPAAISQLDDGLKSDLARWQALPQEQRKRIAANFNRLFSLDDAKVERGLQSLSETERQRVRILFATFAQLTPEQRSKCIEAFNKFANMTAEERARFLKNAARWKAMTPEEQRVWRTLTSQLPPTPPGFPSLIPTPPIPQAPANTNMVRLTNHGFLAPAR